jgi:hypothetical protein
MMRKPESKATQLTEVFGSKVWSTGPPIDQLRENMRKMFRVNTPGHDTSTCTVDANSFKIKYEHVIGTTIPHSVRISALVERVSSGTDEWTFVYNKKRKHRKVVWKELDRDPGEVHAEVHADAEAEEFLSSMEPQPQPVGPQPQPVGPQPQPVLHSQPRWAPVLATAPVTWPSWGGMGGQVPPPHPPPLQLPPLSQLVTQPVALGALGEPQTVVPQPPQPAMGLQQPVVQPSPGPGAAQPVLCDEPLAAAAGATAAPMESSKGRDRSKEGEDQGARGGDRGGGREGEEEEVRGTGRDRSEGFEGGRHLLSPSCARDTKPSSDRSGSGGGGDGGTGIRISPKLKQLVTRVLDKLHLPCHPNDFFTEFKNLHGDEIYAHLPSKPKKALDVVRAMPDVMMLVPQPGHGTNTYIDRVKVRKTHGQGGEIQVGDTDWSITGPPIDQLRKDMRKMFRVHRKGLDTSTCTVDANFFKTRYERVIGTAIPHFVRISALVERVSSGTDEWTFVHYNKRKNQKVVWKELDRDPGEAEEFLSSMEPQPQPVGPQPQPVGLQPQPVLHLQPRWAPVWATAPVTWPLWGGMGGQVPPPHPPPLPLPPLSQLATQPVALGAMVIPQTVVPQPPQPAMGLQQPVVQPSPGPGAAQPVLCDEPLAAAAGAAVMAVAQPSAAVSSGTILELIPYTDKEDSIFVAQMRHRVVRDEANPKS